MKFLSTFPLIFCLVLLINSCGTEKAAEITEFRLKEATTCGISAHCVSTNQHAAINVSFVGSCVTIASAKELLNIVMATSQGEITLTNIQKRSGMFCSPNKADITTVWVSTVDKKVSRHNNLNVEAFALK